MYENVLEFFLKSENIPVSWKNFFMKIANGRDNLVNIPKTFIQHCREKHFYDFS